VSDGTDEVESSSGSQTYWSRTVVETRLFVVSTSRVELVTDALSVTDVTLLALEVVYRMVE